MNLDSGCAANPLTSLFILCSSLQEDCYCLASRTKCQDTNAKGHLVCISAAPLMQKNNFWHKVTEKMVENSFSLTKIFRLKTLIPQIPEKYEYNVDIRLMESVEYVLVVTLLCRTLSVMIRNVTQRINERVEENHIKDSQTIPYDDLRRAKRRHSKHFRVQVISLTKLAFFLREEN